MRQSLIFTADMIKDQEILWQDRERALGRWQRPNPDGGRGTVLVAFPVAENPGATALDRLAHEYGLKDSLDGAWAARPVELVREGGRAMLVLEDPGGEPLERLLDDPMETGRFLRLAIDIASALGKAHQRGLLHKDVKPANILVNCDSGQARLTGFGVASRLRRERQGPEPPEIVAGTLAYMAPEQTGRMNRSIDSRSDLYALGVTFYRMLTGVLPFAAADPMEWVHCHIARRPAPLAERSPAVLAPLSDIVMKLLAKPAEERYQTAAALERDLRRCLDQWDRLACIDPFPLGERDVPDRLVFPERLYGREREVEALIAAFDRVVGGGAPELVLVSGYSGIGKSSVVNELQKALVPSRGLFASGKFDQLKRDIPYSTLAQAFQGLVRPLLGKSDAELSRWRSALQAALGPNGKLMTDLVPELGLVIGEQPQVAELDPLQAKGRFQAVLRRFIEVFARPEHPLALFLDDLQWADAGTLDFLEDALVGSYPNSLLLIGAYRDNEVDAAHPLMKRLSVIRNANPDVSEIILGPLASPQVESLTADTLRTAVRDVAPLAQLIYAKAGGSPFFTLQFLDALASEGLLAFNPDSARWRWDVDGVHAKGYAANVVDLMVGKLVRLPAKTRQALQQLACLGNAADFSTVAVLLETSEDDVHAALWEAMRAELIERLPGSYRFVHDRVEEAAYSLIPKERRAETHLKSGRLLLARTPPDKQADAVFEIVGQLNRGAVLMTSHEERKRLAELNLAAGKRAKASAAYASALGYLAAGDALLSGDEWTSCYQLAFQLKSDRAECEFLVGALAEAESRLADLAHRAANLPDLAAVTRLRVEIFTALGQSGRSIDVGLDYLRRIGVPWSAHPTQEEVQQEYEQIWRQLGERPIEALLDLPPMADPIPRGTMDVLAAMEPPAVYTDPDLRRLVVGRMANLGLEHGPSDASCLAYVWLGTILGPQFGDYGAGFRFGQLGLDLVERRGLDRYKARVHMLFGSFVIHWTQHVRAGRPLIRRAFDAAQEAGDFTYASYSCFCLVTNLLASGDSLAEAQREAEAGLDFARRARLGLAVDFIALQLQFIKTLRGLTPIFGGFDDAVFDEQAFERRLSQDRSASVASQYWARKLQALFLAGATASAVEAASHSQALLWGTIGFVLAEHNLYAALAEAALGVGYDALERGRRLESLTAHHRRLCEFAANCSENFESCAALVAAEIARLESRAIDAIDLYEQAIRSARENGFVHIEALANELAARFYAARGLEKISRAYMEDARSCYLRWGADGKVRQLDQIYSYLRPEGRPPGATSTIGAPLEQLDLATVIKVSQAASGEIVFEKLIETLMRTAIEQAGAERGVLALLRGEELRIAAVADTTGDQVLVSLRDAPLTDEALPESLLLYVQRSRESVLLDDAAALSAFAADPYFRKRGARSVLCQPLLNQTKLIGLIYLENTLAPQVFSPSRFAVLKLLASQAAISLENSRLYRDLADREATIRRLVDANIIGIFTFRIAGDDAIFLEVNDAFLRMVRYDREEFVSSRMRRSDLAPPEWRDRDRRTLAELRELGVAQPFEKEYFRKDGSRVPVLVGFACVDDLRTRGVAFVLDLTEQRHTQQALRDAQSLLAHANRLESLGQLTASIAHEVNQPIAATLANAQAGLRWLRGDPLDLEEVRQAFERIVRDSGRAGAVVQSIRNLVKKAPPRDDRVDINAAVREVIEFIGSEATKYGVSVRSELADGLPPLRGHRVELQQVVLNLILNAIEAMSGMSEGPRRLLIATGMREGDEFLVAVRDSGPGLTPAVEADLFKAFHTTKPNGLGLGLSICRSIVEAHGGRLWASANTPSGTVFQFTLASRPDAVWAKPSREKTNLQG